MGFHYRVLIGMVLGVLAGFALRSATDAPAWSGAVLAQRDGRVVVEEASGPGARAGLRPGDEVVALVAARGTPQERRTEATTAEAAEAWLAEAGIGALVSLERAGAEPVQVQLALHPDSTRAAWLRPVDLGADLFLALLKMLIVPLVLSSVISGVAGVGTLGNLRRLGIKTFSYYLATSLLAILLGQALVTAFRPGEGARLGLPLGDAGTTQMSLLDVLRRAIPENVPAALSDNGEMLAVIFFALVFGVAIARTAAPHGERMRELFEALAQVSMTLAKGVLSVLPVGVGLLLLRVVANMGFEVFKPLLFFMALVTVGLVIHGMVTLPLILRVLGGVSPRRWARAMAPVIVTAFSTSSSNMTLPVTLETVEGPGKVSRRVTGFTIPLGATINMDGTALYECMGVVFLAQYYASIGGEALSLSAQFVVVVLALMASIGAAGIPSAGLVTMLMILSALDLPLEGAALLLAVDRPLDMLRTVINVWSDTCGAAVIARSEGETGPLEAG